VFVRLVPCLYYTDGRLLQLASAGPGWVFVVGDDDLRAVGCTFVPNRVLLPIDKVIYGSVSTLPLRLLWSDASRREAWRALHSKSGKDVVSGFVVRGFVVSIFTVSVLTVSIFTASGFTTCSEAKRRLHSITMA
jgi:hypothetical protein